MLCSGPCHQSLSCLPLLVSFCFLPCAASVERIARTSQTPQRESERHCRLGSERHPLPNGLESHGKAGTNRRSRRTAQARLQNAILAKPPALPQELSLLMLRSCIVKLNLCHTLLQEYAAQKTNTPLRRTANQSMNETEQQGPRTKWRHGAQRWPLEKLNGARRKLRNNKAAKP